MEGTTPARTPERDAFYDRIAPRNLAPLWEGLHQLVTPKPATPVHAGATGTTTEVRPYLMQAGALITAKEAERRVLILENPGMRGQACITHSPVRRPAAHPAGRGGAGASPRRSRRCASSSRATAPTPRSTASAPDAAGRFRHHAELDLARPRQRHRRSRWCGWTGWTCRSSTCSTRASPSPPNAESQAVTRPAGDSLARFGANLLPVDWKPTAQTSPVFNYPYARTREALATLARKRGCRMRATATSCATSTRRPASTPMPTIGTFMQLLPEGFATAPYRCTDGTVFVVVEGEGETRVGDTSSRWRPRDMFVVPSWHWHCHRPTTEAVLFSFSDRPVQEKLGLWREDRGNH